MEKSKCISLNDVRERLGISLSAVYKLAQSKGFPSFKIGARYLVPEQAFEDWVSEQLKAQNANREDMSDEEQG